MVRLVFYLLMGLCVARAHDPITTKLTWSQEISRIVYKRCISCHGENGKPMSLLTYDEARPWAKAIRDEVLNRRMPPWGAIKGFGEFRDDASLTQEEITRLAQWVEGGAPEGDPIYLPLRPPASNAEPYPAGVRVKQLPEKSKVLLLGLRPLASVADAKLTAHLPDGTIVPLIWLHQYRKEWNRTFLYREPLKLPAGTRISSQPVVPVEFLLGGRKLR